MEAAGIVIHKGEKEERYQLYVEDYVISYLKNYGFTDNRPIFFYGTREPGYKKYYIYGAGRQKQISYFEKYALLDEITCRYVMDMPVFYVREDSETYELAGYNIFYQNNEAMQSYLIEQRRLAESEEKEQNKDKTQTKSRPQGTGELQKKVRPQSVTEMQRQGRMQSKAGTQYGGKAQGKTGNRIMAVQLSAIFVILAAIVINSTNSYTKLKDLNQAAVEVFFAIENQEASETNAGGDGQAKESASVKESLDDVGKGFDAFKALVDDTEEESEELTKEIEGVTLRLEELDAKFEEENQIAKQEDAEEKDTGEDETEDQDEEAEDEDIGTDEMKEDKAEGTEAVQEEEGEKNTEEAEEKEAAAIEQAFARNFAEYYQIEKGDTLSTISIKLYGDASKVNDICELNQITDPDCIKYGQKILLP